MSYVAHSGWHTHHAKTPDAQIVDKQPRLLRESHRGLLLQPCLSRQRPEDPINEHRPDRRESQNRAENIVRVIPTGAVQTRLGLVIGQLEKGRRKRSHGRVEVVGGEEGQQDGQGDP